MAGTILLSWTAALIVSAQNPQRPIQAVGEFSDMRFTQEHAYGNTVQLWRDGDSLVGLLFVSQGLQGDTPAGPLQNVNFDQRTGSLSFSAKLSLGVTLLPAGKQEPSQDLFEFSGILDATGLRGTLKWTDPRRPATQDSERVQLTIQKQSLTLPASSYAEWKREADLILKYRGPRW